MDAGSDYLNRPIRTLDEVAAARQRLAEICRQAEIYASFQQLRDLVTDWHGQDDLRAQLSHKDMQRAWAVLRQARGF